MNVFLVIGGNILAVGGLELFQVIMTYIVPVPEPWRLSARLTNLPASPKNYVHESEGTSL